MIQPIVGGAIRARQRKGLHVHPPRPFVGRLKRTALAPAAEGRRQNPQADQSRGAGLGHRNHKELIAGNLGEVDDPLARKGTRAVAAEISMRSGETGEEVVGPVIMILVVCPTITLMSPSTPKSERLMASSRPVVTESAAMTLGELVPPVMPPMLRLL